MSGADFYPHRARSVEVRQTHISFVFLAGEYVYKVKKAVRLPFLDYSTLDRRFRFCQEEVRLNRRLAPSTYLGVVPILKSDGRFVLGERPGSVGQREVAEYAVKMRRLPEERMLDRLLLKDEAGKDEIRAIARKLVSFHRSAGKERAASYGSPEAVRRLVEDNFRETEPFVGRAIGKKMFQFLERYSREFLDANFDLFRSRLRWEKVREGHGDLRAEHICLLDDVVIFDCVEFDEGLRTSDVASELAFLAMDLDFLGATRLSTDLVQDYEMLAGDEMLFRLMDFYKAYRAHVRAKVESLKSQEAEVPEQERELSQRQAGRYFRLAYRYARGGARPALLVVCGMVGSGKSTLARALGDLTGFQILQSDAVRKRLARREPTERLAEEYRSGIYSDRFSDLTYRELRAEAREILLEAKGAIVDATFRDPRQRRLFLELAQEIGAPILFLECQAGEREIFRRLKEREGRAGEISDATWDTYLRQKKEFMPLTEVPERFHLKVDTSNLQKGLEAVDERLFEKPSS